jgi:predicted DNA-binding transcriptional regulator AlpA
MKSKTNKIAAGPALPGLSETDATPLQEPLVTCAKICALFGMSRTTVWRNVTEHGMPKHPIGTGYRIRFVVSEVQSWLEKNQRVRFAKNGKEAVLEKVRKRIVLIPILNGIEIVMKSNRPHPDPLPQEREQHVDAINP